jgi:hypothetical protein
MGGMIAQPSHRFARGNIHPSRRIAQSVLLKMKSMVCLVAKACLAGLRHSGFAYSIEAAGVFHENHDP